MKIQRAFKVRLYPTPEQRVFLNKTLGCCRFLYNQMLAERIETFKTLKDNREALYAHKYKTEKDYKQEHEFLKEADAFTLQQSRRNLEAAYANFFTSLKGIRKGEAAGFPRFKSKHNHNDSYRTGMSIAVHFEGQTVKLPKIKEPVRFKHRVNIKSRYPTAELKTITISISPAGKYYASCLFEGEQDFQGFQEKTEKLLPVVVIGLDMSLQDFYVDNLGRSPEYRRVYRNSEKRLGKYQRRLSRKPKGSRNREKARLKTARIHERTANFRRNFIDALSYRLVREYDVIVVEHLSLKGMSQALNLGKSVMDLGYAAFVKKLQYKALWNDKTVIAADKWFASSKTCHVCGYVKKDLLLRERAWECPSCGSVHHRDANAAMTLAELGKTIPTRRGELTSVDMAALALGNKGETAVETPEMGKSRNAWGASRATGPSLKPLPLGLG